jgi:VanZ family protein
MWSSRGGAGYSTLRTATYPRGPRFWISAWWPVALGIAVIAIESTAWFGADHTSHPLRVLWQAIFGHVTDHRWEVIHHYMRKSGHFLGYGLIGLAWLRAWRMSLPGATFLIDLALSMAGTVLIATSDEFHQSFLPNRTASPRDVLLDCTGAFVLQMLFYALLRVSAPHRLQRAP